MSLPLRHALARRLADAQGAPLSGEALARDFGISRAAVAKHIAALRDKGFQVEATPRVGYRLPAWPDILAPEAVSPLLPEAPRVGRPYRYVPSCGSTNSMVFQEGLTGAPHGLTVAAETQTAGRGRRGRSWHSPPGTGLFFSVLLRPALRPMDAPPLTLACAVAVAEALEGETGLSPRVKWPNDLLLGERKCCGILLEMSAEPERIDFIVAGIGINISTPNFPKDIKASATSLQREVAASAHDSAPLSRPRLLAAILDSLGRWVDRYVADGMEPVREAWRDRAAWLGEAVTIHAPDGVLHGVATDVSAQGALLVRDEAGTSHEILAGDVSLRRPDTN